MYTPSINTYKKSDYMIIDILILQKQQKPTTKTTDKTYMEKER